MEDVIVAATIALLFWVLIILLTFRHALRRTSIGVMQQLRHAGDQHQVRASVLDWSGIWNPAEPTGSFSRVYGRGVGVYWLDDTRKVHLTWTPKSGPEQHLVGPMPKRLDKKAPSRRRVRRLTWAILAVYAASLVLGFAAGYGWSTGSSGRRVLIGAFGALGGYFAGYVVLMVVLVIHSMRKQSRDAAN